MQRSVNNEARPKSGWTKIVGQPRVIFRDVDSFQSLLTEIAYLLLVYAY